MESRKRRLINAAWGSVQMRSRTWRLVTVALALALLGGCSFSFLSSKRKTDVEVVVAFTGNNNGELKPCG
jgi:hypothetical protein